MVSVIASAHTSEVMGESGDRRVGVWTVVVAGGTGQRFGGSKQLVELGGVRVIDRSVAVAAQVSESVVVVLPAEFDLGYDHHGLVPVLTTAGGPTRSDSVRNGLALVPDHAEVVLVHDGARPLGSVDLFGRVIQAVRDSGTAVVPAVPVVDSLRHRLDGAVDRSNLMAVQTPQGFPPALLMDAHAFGDQASDDATLVEARGGQVVIVDGESDNLKITTPHDLAVAEVIVGQHRGLAEGQSPASNREDHDQ